MKRITILVISILMSLCVIGNVFAAGDKESSANATPMTFEKPDDLLAKYSPEITVSAWRYLNNGIKFEPGESIENNVYIKSYKEDLGINLVFDWTVPEEQFDQKLNIAIASGQLPDIMWLKNKQLIDLAENGLLYDLTDLYETHTSDFTKSILQQDQASFDTAKVGGRLMAIPHTGSAVDSLQILYVRTDWLQKVGKKIPTTMQELIALAETFTTKDPDGNGKNDTFGIALTKNFIKDNHAGATGFVAAYHGYIRRWVKGSSGNLVYGSIQPEVKTALASLQDMFKRGLLDQEFGVKDRAKVTESITSGKVGITYGGMSTPGAFLKNNVLADPKAEWQAIPLVSIDSKPAAPITKMPVQRYYAVSAKSKHPDALLKLLESGSSGYAREQTPEAIERNKKFGVTPSGISTFQYAIVGYEPALKNLNAHIAVLDAIAKKDTSKLSAEEFGYHEKIMLYRNTGDRNYWGEERIFGTPSSFDIIQKYVDGKYYLYDGFYGAVTPTMVEKQATLEAMEDEVFTKIIMGDSLASFDKFVEDWKKLGGDQITKEVNEWYARNK